MPESFGEKGRPLFLWDLFLGEIPQPLFFFFKSRCLNPDWGGSGGACCADNQLLSLRGQDAQVSL